MIIMKMMASTVEAEAFDKSFDRGSIAQINNFMKMMAMKVPTF